MKHTPPRSPVTVSVTSTTAIGEITVADSGPGMTAEQAAHVFERFYRTDDARTRARGGVGLGLSIAASLVAAHGGDIIVDTLPGQGPPSTSACRWPPAWKAGLERLLRLPARPKARSAGQKAPSRPQRNRKARPIDGKRRGTRGTSASRSGMRRISRRCMTARSSARSRSSVMSRRGSRAWPRSIAPSCCSTRPAISWSSSITVIRG